MSRTFASQADLGEKNISFVELAPGAYAYTAEGDPNAGAIIGDDSVLIIEALATPLMAEDLIRRVREVTDKPIKHLVLSHYHAVRVLGASAYHASEIIMSEDTRDLVVERGQQDYDSELGRFPRLFRGADSIPGLTWPTVTFRGRMTLWLGSREVQIMQLGAGHTKGDTVIWLPRERVLYSGDLVEYGATPYTGDAYLTDWPGTLDNLEALAPQAVVPGRGEALTTADTVRDGFEGTRAFTSELLACAKQSVAAGHSLKECYDHTYAKLQPRFGHWVIFEHCMPFDVSRAFDEASGIRDPRIWTAERDQEMWQQLAG